jgi:F0F1-type ATP synthase epsilon subunit
VQYLREESVHSQQDEEGYCAHYNSVIGGGRVLL